MGYILFIIGLIVSIPIYTLGLLYGVGKLVYLYTNEIFKTLAIGLSQFGNVVCADLFNDTLITKDGIKFGATGNTTSKFLGINKKNGTLTWLGKKIAQFLNWIDKDHVEKAAGLK
jgi:hypothetical protein